MKCEACGGDGQIEYGAYRGDEAGPTRECRLCGGVITTHQTAADVIGAVSARASSASAGLNRLARKVSESGKRVTDLIITTERSAKERYQDKCRLERRNTNRVKALQSARKVADEHAERLRGENERQQLEAESRSATPTSAIMNDLIRRL